MNDAGVTATRVCVEHLDLFYSDFHALKDVSVSVPARQITALIGPSGCGKSTLLRTLNRMNDMVPGVRVRGRVLFEGDDIDHPTADVERLRRRIGMVFQRPNPFPLSVFDNVAYGPRLHGRPSRAELNGIVEESLRGVGL